MLRFVLAYLSVMAVLATWVVVEWPDYWVSEDLPQYMLAGLILSLPVGVAWGTAAAFERARPSRLMNPKVKTVWAPAVAGLAAGVLSVIAFVLLLTYFDEFLSDAVSLMLGAAAGTGAVMLVQRRPRPGRCINCGYDLSSLEHVRCPECGVAVEHLGVRATS